MDLDKATTKENTSFITLLSDLTREVTSLIRQEVELAKAEVSQNISQAVGGIASIAIAGAVLFAGFLVLLAAAVYGLNTVLPPEMTPWLSALIVGVVVIIIGFIMLQAGRKKLKSQSLRPDRTMASVRSDQRLATKHEAKVKEQVK